jgi:hypothetical protein
MGFKQSSAASSASTSVRSGDLFSAVLAGFGIWTKPSSETKPNAPVSVASPLAPSSNVYPLRGIRVIRANDNDIQAVNAQNMPKMAGRMVISGRMADVCAELDRLAA